MKPLAPVLFGLTVLRDIVMGAPKKDLGSAGPASSKGPLGKPVCPIPEEG